jgi:hypothetical protein
LPSAGATSNITVASFTVTLSAPSTQPVTVAYATQDGTATLGADYIGSQGTLSFTPGQTQLAINIPVRADPSNTTDEAFSVVLLDPINGALADATGTATIRLN